MRSRVIIAAVVTLVVVASSWPGGAVATEAEDERRLESKILRTINRRRDGRGLNTLDRSALIVKLAREHSRFLAANRVDRNPSIAHSGFAQRKEEIREEEGVRRACENVAAVIDVPPSQESALARRIVDAWYGSEANRNCLFDESFDGEIGGVGVDIRRDDFFVTFIAAGDP